MRLPGAREPDACFACKGVRYWRTMQENVEIIRRGHEAFNRGGRAEGLEAVGLRE